MFLIRQPNADMVRDSLSVVLVPSRTRHYLLQSVTPDSNVTDKYHTLGSLPLL